MEIQRSRNGARRSSWRRTPRLTGRGIMITWHRRSWSRDLDVDADPEEEEEGAEAHDDGRHGWQGGGSWSRDTGRVGHVTPRRRCRPRGGGRGCRSPWRRKPRPRSSPPSSARGWTWSRSPAHTDGSAKVSDAATRQTSALVYSSSLVRVFMFSKNAANSNGATAHLILEKTSCQVPIKRWTLNSLPIN